MSTSPTPAAWESDDFWKEAVRSRIGDKKLRSDSYLHTLSAEELDSLREVLLSPLPLALQREAMPKWKGGPNDGSPPSMSVASELGEMVRMASSLRRMEAQAMLDKAVSARARVLGISHDTTEALLSLMAEEGMRESASGQPGAMLKAATNAHLKFDSLKFERQKFAEAKRKKIEAGLDEVADKFKAHPEAMELYKQARELIAREME